MSPVDRKTLGQVAELVIDSQFAAVTFVQRRLSLGFAQARDAVTLLENFGIVGPPDGSRARDVLVVGWAEHGGRVRAVTDYGRCSPEHGYHVMPHIGCPLR